jgi:DNA-damage-inducible protein J
MDNATAPITFHMNAELAANFEKACQKLGLTTSEAFTIFATNVARETHSLRGCGRSIL